MVLLPWTRERMMLLGAMACLLLFRFIYIKVKRRIPQGLHLPPGPPGRPVVGNVSDMPTHYEWETVTRWAKMYGDLVHVKVLGTHVIYVNSVDIADELFEKRSSIYSDRFDCPMLIDLMGLDWDFAFMRHGERWRRHRRIFNQKFRQAAVVLYQDIQIKQTRKFLKALHEAPSEFMKKLRYLSGAIIMETTYGIELLPEADPYVRTAEKALSAIAEAGIPGTFLVDIFPILKHVPEWMPGAGFHKKARDWRVPITEMVVKPFEVAKKSLINGTAKPSIVASLMEDLFARADAPPDGEELVRNVTGMAYIGGADTTASALATFILAMVLYPEVQRKAQNELDSVIGMDRLPEFQDRKNLPYVNAVCNEVLRWHPFVPLGMPHRVTQDDSYGGFFIPKGSVVVGNSWGMLRDERYFGSETEKFKPERFLNSGVRPPTSTFGFGRRICPGRSLAENSIFIAVAHMLKVFNISHGIDSSGEKIPVKENFTSGLVSYPEPFQCNIKLRPGLPESILVQAL